MKNKIFTVILATFVGLYLPACAGGGDDGMLLFPLGGPTEGGPEESPQDITDGLEIVVAEEAVEVVEEEDPETPAAESVTDTEAAESATGGDDSGAAGGDSGTASGDTGSAGDDSGTAGGDTGSTGGDSGTASGDTGSTGGDSGTTGGDGDVAGGDSGTSGGDSGSSSGVPADGSETSGDTVAAGGNGNGGNSGNNGNGNGSGDVAGGNNGNGGNSAGNGNSGNNGNSGDVAGGNGNAGGNGAACNSRTSALDPTQGRWFQDGKKGFYTFWARQTLLLKVRGNCEAGWYKLMVKATNTRGPLPDFYSNFNLNVQDNISGRTKGGMLIKAKDNGYHMGQMYVYLEAGDTDLNLMWTNDAYKKGVYDANILIADVMLHKNPTQRVRKNDERSAVNYCYEKGRWFYNADEGTARTYWRNQTIGFCFYDLPAGTYEVEIEARNYGKTGLPPGYKNFQVNVAADGVAGEAIVPAHEKAFKKGKVVLDLRGGDATVNLTWLNDRYKKGEYDANIEIRSVRLKRIGDSSRTGLSAFLSNAGQGTGLVITVSVVVALLGLGLLYAYRRKTGEQNA